MPRSSRRQELLDVARGFFVERGYDGTSVGDIAAAVDVSKAAVSYHFPAKDDLLLALASPLLEALEALVAATAGTGFDEEGVRGFLTRYLDVLVAHDQVATWLDADRGALAHDEVGKRLDAVNEATRRLLAGDGGNELAAASALGALWRPVRNLDVDSRVEREQLVEAALAALVSGTT